MSFLWIKTGCGRYGRVTALYSRGNARIRIDVDVAIFLICGRETWFLSDDVDVISIVVFLVVLPL